MSLSPTWAKLARSCLKNKVQNQRTGSMAQVVEHLPKMCEALSLTHSTAKKSVLNLQNPKKH
jgi:hypothetical protein